jgi:tetratricopeptide (TPR) repeat protein
MADPELREKIASCEAILARCSGEAGSERLIADTLFEKGYLLGELGQLQEKITCYEEIVARFGDADSLEMRRQVARALLGQGAAWRALGREDKASAVFAEVAARVADATDPELRDYAMRAQYAVAHWHLTSGREVDALEVLASLLNRYSDAEPPAHSLGTFLSAFGLAASVADRLGNRSEAVRMYDDLIRRYRPHTEPEIRASVAVAMVGKATAVGRAGDSEQAVELLDAALAHIGDPITPDLRNRAAEAQLFRGNWLERRGRPEQALADYREVVERFADDDSAIIDLQRTRARERIAVLAGGGSR